MTISRRSLLKSAILFSAGTAFGAYPAFSQMPQHNETAGAAKSSADEKSTPDAKALKIGVIGAGWLGGTVGSCLAKAGHSVMFSSRHPEALKKLAAPLGKNALIGTPKEAAAFGDVVLISVPFQALPQIGKDCAQELKGKIVIDATNPPLSGGSDLLTVEARKNGVAETVKKYLPDTRLVRAFSAVDATVVEACFNHQREAVGMPMASDDEAALKVVEKLVSETGCEPVVTGNLASSASFSPDAAGFRAHLPADKLRKLLKLQ